ncbi:hypothetical protein [Phascolarctobacterium sp.]|uniref:hypothetical protein n=1 Tax=Phascolarctobacterium sp. TaxID=2049039 RepID=UPI0025CE0BE7|nr:hypothetical protein [Phascolarctobacterium sp.]
MLTQIKNVRFYLQARLGQRGAEMVEYAIVLACIASVGVLYYHYTSAKDEDQTLTGILNILFRGMSSYADKAK